MLSTTTTPVNSQATSSCPLTSSPRTKYTEPLTRTEDLLLPGMIVSSPGNSFQYQIMSYAFCRIFWEKGKLEPHSFESSWYQDETGKWRKNGPNKLSYLVRLVEGNEVFPWTFRVKPIILNTESIPDWANTYCFIEQSS